MHRLPHIIVKNRRVVLAIALALLIPSVYGMLNAWIEYDLMSYLPGDLNSIKGMEILDQEFHYADRAIVVVRDQPDWKILKLKEDIEQVDGVSSVFWISDLADPAIPHDYLGDELISQFYRGDITFLLVHLSQGGISPEAERTIADIKELLESNQYLIGQVVSGVEMKDLGMSQTPDMIRAAVILIFLVLLVTLPSAAMPFIFMVTIGAAYAYNMGLSYILGQRVSYITNSCAAALQLGVTMDYCIFLIHSFQAERKKHDAETAMEKAIASTATAVLASAVTTATGFAALALMRVRLGADMGFLMARGVILSVIATLTILPSLVLVFQETIEKLAHKSILPKFDAVAGWAIRRRVPVFALAAAIMAMGYYGYSKVELSYDLEATYPRDIPSIVALDEFSEELGSMQEAYVVLRDVPGWRQQQISAELGQMEGVISAECLADVVDPAIPLEFVPEEVRKRYVGGNYSNIIISLEGSGTEAVTEAFMADVRDALEGLDTEWYFTGNPVIGSDLRRLTDRDMIVVNAVSVVAIFIIVMIAFRSATVSLALVAAIMSAIWANQAISWLLDQPLFFFSGLAIGAIQLGATVDYAILVASTFREKLSKCEPQEGMRQTMIECGPAILNSGLALFAAIMGVYSATTLRAVKELGVLLARGALISMGVAAVLLPPVLLILHPILARTSVGWPAGRSNGQA
ncbi:MAG: MMPL family transporter [Firmicutes bacterium]|nr:MMPL family transporter [Bacillota bacterium]